MDIIKRWVKNVYQTPVHLTGDDYKKGQNLFILECICGTSLTRLTQGAFIAGFAKMLGMSQGLIGMISAVPMLANILQFLGGIYFGNIEQYKFSACFGSLIARSLMGTIYFLPLLLVKTKYQAMSLIIIYCTAYFLFAFLNPPLVNWIMELTPESIRGQYFAKREAITMIIVAVGEIIIAQMLDFFKIQKAEQMGFTILGIIVVIWSLINFYSISAVKEPIRSKDKKKINIKQDLYSLLDNTSFRKLGNLYMIWNFALYVGMLYIAIYMLVDLKMSYLYTMVMSMIALGFRVLSVRWWGKFVERNLWSKAIEIGAILLGISTGLLFFADIKTALIILPLFHILSGIAWGSIGITFFNLQVMFAPDEKLTLYVGALASISGISGFIATTISGFFIDIFTNIHILVLGFSVGNMQIIFLISGTLLVLSGLYVHRVIAPMERAKKNSICEACEDN